MFIHSKAVLKGFFCLHFKQIYDIIILKYCLSNIFFDVIRNIRIFMLFNKEFIMYLHIGGEYAVKISDIVAVFDMDNTTVAKASRNFLSAAQKRNEIINTTDDIPKSYVITFSNKKVNVYLSALSSIALLRRAEEAESVLYGKDTEYYLNLIN